MNVAKYVFLAVLALPFLELAVFIAVAHSIGFTFALMLIVAGSLAGSLVLRHAGGNHVARVRVAMGDGGFSAVQADGPGFAILFAGILLLIPGFITDAVGILLLIAPLRRALASLAGFDRARARDDGVVDLDPAQWHQVPDPALPRRRNDDPNR